MARGIRGVPDHSGDPRNIKPNLCELIVAGILEDPVVGYPVTDDAGCIETVFLGTFKHAGPESADDGVVFERQDRDLA